jgi:hypothetical protein
MTDSEKLLRGMKRETRQLGGIFLLIVLWKWLAKWMGFTGIWAMTEDGLLLELTFGVLILRLWLIDCTETILAAIKEGTTKSV